MHISARAVLLGSVLGLSWPGISRAEDATCQGIYASNCWATLSGPNYCQVAVGHTPGGNAGIACAVTISQEQMWGGVLHCYSGVGTSAAEILGRGGEEAQNPGPFSSFDGTKRMVSLAIKPENTPSGLGVRIFILRSDGHLFEAVTKWPLVPGGDPRIFFTDTGAPHLGGIREIAWAPTVGLVATTTANQKYVWNGIGWNALPNLGGAFMLGGNNDTVGDAFYAITTKLSTTSIGNFGSGGVATLPGLLAGDPSFTGFGRPRPLVVGGPLSGPVAYATIKKSSSSLCAGLPPLRPCILQASKSPIYPYGWGPWTLVPTRDIEAVYDPMKPYGMPWTVQDGFYMHGNPGEIWVIAGAQHLKFWVP